jgi:hypothetical protein
MSSGPGSDMVFVWWDDPGDSQSHVDKQEENSGCCNHAKQQEEDERAEELRWMAIMRNGNEGIHYPEYKDYMDDSDEE